MPLTKEDLESIGNLFDAKVKAIKDDFTAAINKMGKRVQRLEDVVTDMARAARRAVTASAKVNHDRLLRAMFDESTLVAVPPLQEDANGKLSRPTAACTIDNLRNKLQNTVSNVKFELEPTKVGFRILLSSFSSQMRRQSAAKIIKDAKKEVTDSLNLLLQYDKPYELRILQKEAHKFLAALKKRSNGRVESKVLKDGFLVVNGVRIAPEYLVPGPGRWDELAEAVIQKMASWRGKPLQNVEYGVLTDYFGSVFAEEKGVIMPACDDDEPMWSAGSDFGTT
jgi:hypothetical protein